jgi:hypothetical protein
MLTLIEGLAIFSMEAKMKLVRNEMLLRVDEMLNRLSESTDIRFGYGIARNKKRFGEVIDALNIAREKPRRIQEWEVARQKIAEEHCVRHPKTGMPIVDPNGFYSFDDKDAFDAALEAVREPFLEDIDDYEKKRLVFVDMLKDEVEVDPYEVKWEHIPGVKAILAEDDNTSSGNVKAHDLFLMMEVGILAETPPWEG